MIDEKKQTVSVRMSASDHVKVKEIAQRLHVRESDLFRFAVKNAITKLMPLYDRNFKGKDLIPLFIEFGQELTSYFELDTMRLDEIINEGVDNTENRVDWEDLNLIAMSGMRENYLYIRLNYLNQELTENGNAIELENSSPLKRYFYKKYIMQANRSAANNQPTNDTVGGNNASQLGVAAGGSF